MRSQVEEAYRETPIEPGVIERNSAGVVRKPVEEGGPIDMVLDPDDGPSAPFIAAIGRDPDRPRERGSILLGLARILIACGVVSILLSLGRGLFRDLWTFADQEWGSAARAPDRATGPARFPNGRSEGEFGPIFAKTGEASKQALALTRGRYGDNYSKPNHGFDAACAWASERALYLNDMYFRNYMELSMETGLSVFELLDVQAEGAARGWDVPLEKRAVRTPEEIQRRYDFNKAANVFLEIIFRERL